MNSDIEAVFQEAGCTGSLYVEPLNDTAGIGLAPDELAIQASVVKVQVALEAETCFADGRLDPREPVTLSAAEKSFGLVGTSLFDDDAVISLRDLVILMITLSDNYATDTLLRRTGVDAVNSTAARLGLTSTVVMSDEQGMLECIGQEMGYANWADLVAWYYGKASPEEVADADMRMRATWQLDPARGTRTTARDMVRLLKLIWAGEAGPAAACDRVKAVMAMRVTRHRIASAFPRSVKVPAKTGSLFGLIRNEIGVVSYPDGSKFAVAVFTRAPMGADDQTINNAIGVAAAKAVDALRK
jgi:beta-lactamase class A